MERALPELLDIRIKQGSAWKHWFAVIVDGVVQNLTTLGYTTATMVIRDAYGGTELARLTTANGGIAISFETSSDGLQNSGYWYMSPAATAALTDWGDGVYDFDISNGSDVIPGLTGSAVLDPETTTP